MVATIIGYSEKLCVLRGENTNHLFSGIIVNQQAHDDGDSGGNADGSVKLPI